MKCRAEGTSRRWRSRNCWPAKCASSSAVYKIDRLAGVAGGLAHGAHGAFGALHARVCAVGVNLVAAEFGLLAFAGHDDGAAGGIDFNGMMERDFGRHQ